MAFRHRVHKAAGGSIASYVKDDKYGDDKPILKEVKGGEFRESDSIHGKIKSRPGRRMGGAVGADRAPLSSASKGCYASGGAAKDHWIEGATKNKKGALHRKLGVPEGEKIPAKKLAKAEHSKNPTERKEADLAKTLKGMHH